MTELIQSYLTNPTWTAGIIVAAIALHYMIKEWKGFLQFHADHFSKRRFTRFKEASAFTAEGSVPSDFVKTALQAEVFDALTGIRATPNESRTLMTLYAAGDLTLRELRGLKQYIQLKQDGLIEVVITKSRRRTARFGLILGIGVLIYLGTLMIVLLPSPKPGATLAAAGLMVVGFLVFLLLASDHRWLKAAEALQTKLGANPVIVS